MQGKHDAIVRAINNNSGNYNILTAPTHEAFQSNWATLNHTFYLLQTNGFKPWNNAYRKLPNNHILLDGSDTQVRHDMKFDLILSQNKFGHYQVFDKIAEAINVPLISLEHTLPVPAWGPNQRESVKNMRGNINVFISEYSVREWGFDKNDPTVRIIHHGIDTKTFTPKKDSHNDGRILSVVNDWIQRDWCMPSGQKVLTDHGYVSIENIKIGDKVLTDSGLFNVVTSVFSRKYSGPMVEIWLDNSKKPLRFTTDHNVRVIRNNEESYIEAGRLREGDILKFPSYVQTDFSTTDIDLAWLTGLIIGDGSITKRGRIEICLKQTDREVAERAKLLLEKFTGSKATISERERNRKPNTHVLKVECTALIFGTWLKEKISDKSYNKSIPNFIINGPSDVRLSILKALWFCNGSFKNKNKHGNKACYSTISSKLASQVSSILHSYGVSCNIVRYKRTTNKSNGNIVSIYKLNCYGDSFYKCKDIVEPNTMCMYEPFSYTIKKVNINEDYNDMVFNCEVANDHSYVVYPGFVAHNCCNFSSYKRICLDNNMPTNPVGDTEGFSKAATSLEDLVDKYQKASVFFNTSTISPVPTALLEAMSCGCPVVTTSTCMIPEIVKDGINGWISNDEDYLKDRLEWCLNNPEDARELGNNARQTILEKFSLDKHLSSWNNIFAELHGRTRNYLK